MVSQMRPKEELSICSICYSTYDGDECVFSSNQSHRPKMIQEEPAVMSSTEPTINPIITEQLKVLEDLSRTLNIAISLVGDMVNRYQETMQVLIPTLQQIQALTKELYDGKKDLQ